MNLRISTLNYAVFAALAAASSGAALAQTPAGDDASTLDAVSVTGSRIAIPGVEASSPVAAVERNEFLATQPVAVESFLKEYPALTPSIGSATNNGANGAATIDMRGLGANRTLVLIDGRRPVPFNLEGQIDTNTIPMSLLQSVEMLTGGASVVYGADAVAGVTNFILRRDFEGVELNFNAGESTKSDGARQKYEVTFGALSDDGRANAVLSVGYTHVDPVYQGNRPWSQSAFNVGDGSHGGSINAVPAVVNVRGSGLGNLQIDPATGALGPYTQPYNFNPLNYYQTGLERWQTTALARYELNPHAEAWGQVNYTRSKVGLSLAPSAIFGDVIDIPLANPYIPTAMRQQICSALGIADANCSSGRDTNGDLIYTSMALRRRMPELGPRLDDYIGKTFQTTVGLRGALAGNWNYETFWSYGESDQMEAASNWGSLSKVRQALNAISTTACIDPSNGCVPLNPFDAAGTISRDMLDFINLNAFKMKTVEQTNAAFNVNGDLGDAKSPWADYPIGISSGVEYRRTVAGTNSDAAFQTAREILGSGQPTPDSRGGFTIKDLYAEAIVPLVTGRAGADNLSLEFGYRRSEFSNTSGFDEGYGSWKYGLSWSPVTQVKFRAMRQRATRAPNISELFDPLITGLGNLVTDPCAGNAINQADAGTQGTLSWLCGQTGVPLDDMGILPQPSSQQVNVRVGGNPQLSPEEAETTTIGLVLTPSDRLSLTLDWWNIEIDRAITTLTEQDVIGGCYGVDANPNRSLNAMCALIGRGPDGTFDGAAPGIGQPLSNAGFIQKTGFDLGVRLTHELPGTLGRMQYALDLSKVTRDDFQATPTSVLRDCLGYYSSSCVPSHKLRSNLRATWNVADVSVTLAWRYFGKLAVEPLTEAAEGPFYAPFRHIPSYSYFDLGVSYKAPWNATLSLSVNNVLDKTPPVVGQGIGTTTANSGNTFPQWYDVIGRYVNFGVSFRF